MKTNSNAEVVKNLNSQLEAAKKQIEDDKFSKERNKKINDSLYFDKSDYVQKNFHEPANKIRDEILSTLKIEGAEEAYEAVLRSRNKRELLEVLKPYELDVTELNSVSSNWRNFVSIVSQYSNEKAKAEKDLSSALSTTVSSELTKAVYSSVLDEFSGEEEYQDLKDAIESLSLIHI